MPSNGGAKLNFGPTHNNSNLTCAIDIRVGGTDPSRSDLLEVAFLPLNHSYKVHPQFKLFQMKIRPSWKVDRKIAHLNAENIQDYEKSPFDAVESVGMFCRWADALQLKERKQILPLVWDWAFVKSYLQIWLGEETFAHYMSESHRDLMGVSNFINDRHDVWGEEVPFKNITLSQVLNRKGIDLIERNSITANCVGLIELNRAFLHDFVPGFSSMVADKVASHKKHQCTAEKTTPEPGS